jgi:neutral ceramidase
MPLFTSGTPPFPAMPRLFALLSALVLSPVVVAAAGMLAGAGISDISPTKFPAPVNGSMGGRFADSIHDPMHARALAVQDERGATVIFCTVDACMIPLEICEAVKDLVEKQTGLPRQSMVISATHTHSAATMAAVFQSEPDPGYVAGLPPRIAAAMLAAVENLEPAEVGWGFGSDPSQVFNRRWFMKPGQEYENPFGVTTDRARMNPGNVNPAVSVPTGPVDQDVAVLAARAKADGRPIGLHANYSLHYVGGLPAISADYFGVFCDLITADLNAGDGRYAGKPPFVAALSNGTSGNVNNANYGAPAASLRNRGGTGEERVRAVARSVATAALDAWESVKWREDLLINSSETDLELVVRKPSSAELEQAREWLAASTPDKNGNHTDRKAIYALESIHLADYPDTVPVKLQLHQIGDLTVAAIPCEVFVEIGLELKKTTPAARHFTISLANGYNGYLPTEEHHELGGYETWRARSSYLEVEAASKITAALQQMFPALPR